MLGIEGVLQRLEVSHAILISYHHFAIEPGRVDTERAQGGNLPGHLAAPVMAVAGEQADVLALDAGQDTVAIELDFVAPVAAGGRIHQRCQLWL
ncbi:hypothetical protein D9M71_530500 [compost metagenome]